MKNQINKNLQFSKEAIVELNASTLKATDSGLVSSWTITSTLTTLTRTTTITYPPTITIL